MVVTLGRGRVDKMTPDEVLVVGEIDCVRDGVGSV